MTRQLSEIEQQASELHDSYFPAMIERESSMLRQGTVRQAEDIDESAFDLPQPDPQMQLPDTTPPDLAPTVDLTADDPVAPQPTPLLEIFCRDPYRYTSQI